VLLMLLVVSPVCIQGLCLLGCLLNLSAEMPALLLSLLQNALQPLRLRIHCSQLFPSLPELGMGLQASQERSCTWVGSSGPELRPPSSTF